ncbi:S-adenosylmethionine sensor upstream of mTORC1 [Pectinophora gossypiella]|uniref:S-adenosylmethionine sensor upstream of mTORC1 n=1 Tax=Pectinophora gossypiella TaxID=13191 RepID=A0A1E1WR16_PECGO|nr:S-adenosylmethionine sensor upstream of mTORC1 [Pectinophora gossypiella]XP_049886174.1 S-adenosylmethionine sensor upstream of mTORC1 [Pectinophora gossypiella]XP_049886175.1 S-adenosylmethionine sensor upstream of mTORC1 [Pectinophora gossypiella]
MASEEHKQLAHFLKNVHLCLRKASTKEGAEEAWRQHCENKDVLKHYAQCMEKLATTHWTASTTREHSSVTSRITWAAEFCYDYFINKGYISHRQKDIEISEKINITCDVDECHSQPIKLIDVGSCYNPFQCYDFFDVTAIDLYPANNSVLQCDFLKVLTGHNTKISDMKVDQIQEKYFDVVTFCFLLEYIPTSELRIKACEKAYNIVKYGGLLIINTPDSKHVGANSKIMKCWQYTLANIGFTRIKYEKFKHMHCMAFRKASCKDIAQRWASLHRKPYMQYALHIPQDFNDNTEETIYSQEIKIEVEDFMELPFHE